MEKVTIQGVSTERLLSLDDVAKFRSELGWYLRSMRELNELSLAEAAALIGIKLNTLYKIEQGRFNYGIDLLHKIIETYGYKLDFYEQ